MRKDALVVLEFNSTTVRVCRSVRARGRRSVTHCFFFDAGLSDQKISETIREEFQRRGLREKEIILALPRYVALAQLLRLPSRDIEEIGEIVKLRVGREVPGQVSGSFLYDWRLAGFDKEGYALVIVFLARKDKVGSYLDILESAGLFPRQVTLNIAGLVSWLDQMGSRKNIETARGVYLLNMDQDTIDFNLFLQRNLVFTRTFASPSQDVPGYQDRFLRDLKVCSELAERKAGSFVPPERQIYVTGTARSFSEEEVQKCLGGPVASFLEDGPVSYVAVEGLSSGGRISIDLTPREAKMRRTIRQRFRRTRRCVYIGIFLLGAGAFLLSFCAEQKNGRVLGLREALAAERAAEREAREAAVTAHLRRAVSVEADVPAVLDLLYRAAPAPVFFTTIDIHEGRSLIVSGEGPDVRVLFDFLAALRRSPLIREAQIDYSGAQNRTGELPAKFRIKCLLKS